MPGVIYLLIKSEPIDWSRWVD